MRILTVNGGSTSFKIERYVLDRRPHPIDEPLAATASSWYTPGDVEACLAEALEEGPMSSRIASFACRTEVRRCFSF